MAIFMGTAGDDVLPPTGSDNSGDDSLYGLGGNDELFGGAGQDILQGGDGDDILRGGAGADIFLGGAGNDLVSYYFSTAGVTVNLTTGIHHGGDAEGDSFLDMIDRVNGSSFADTLVGSTGFETLGGQAGDDRLLGLAGNDTLDGGAGVDTLDGGDQNDTLRGGLGGDSFLGGDGVDTVLYTDSTAGVTVNLSTNLNLGGAAEGDRFLDQIEILHGSSYADTITGSLQGDVLYGGTGNDDVRGAVGDDELHGETGADRLDGGGGHDVLFGGAAADQLFGGEGDDQLQGNAGADSLTGGAGVDTVSYLDSAVGVQLNLTTQVLRGGSAEGDQFLDHIEITVGSSFADTMVADGSGNTLIGGVGNDRLTGMGGNDILEGGAGADIMTGGAGIDFISYDGSAPVAINLSTGNFLGGDAVGDQFGDVFEGVIGSRANDSLTGSAAADILDGNAGSDVLVGLAGADRFRGGDGIDNVDYSGSAAAVNVNMAVGAVSQGGDAAGDGFLDVVENVTGTSFADTLVGNAGNNGIDGGIGDDVLTGGGGADSLTGRLGNDRYVYLDVSDSTVDQSDDILFLSAIVNPSAHDFIDLSAIDANTAQAGNQAFTFIGMAAFNGTAGQLRYAPGQFGGEIPTAILADVDGDGVADLKIDVFLGENRFDVVVADFVL